MAEYRLPEDIKLAAISLVKGYDRRKKEFEERFRDIVEATGVGWDEYIAEIGGKDVVCRSYEGRGSGMPGRPVEAKAQRLEKLMTRPDTIRLRAVERAYDEIGERYGSREVRKAVSDGILKNCRSGRRWPYEALDLPGITRKEFYKERRKFLWRVARYAGLI